MFLPTSGYQTIPLVAHEILDNGQLILGRRVSMLIFDAVTQERMSICINRSPLSVFAIECDL